MNNILNNFTESMRTHHSHNKSLKAVVIFLKKIIFIIIILMANLYGYKHKKRTVMRSRFLKSIEIQLK